MEEITKSQEPASVGPSPAAQAPEQSLTVPQAILLEDKVVEVLRACYDPEIPVNIYDLGLIYQVKAETSGDVYVKMTLTAPNCPAAASLPAEIEYRVRELAGVRDVKLDLVWEPPWDRSMMSEAARLQLGLW